MYGLGCKGYPNSNATGEGSVAVLFPSPQSQFKFDIVGSDGGGSATLNFFREDGSSIGSIVITPTDQTYGFRHTGGIREITGFSIHNTDPGGIGYDNICYGAPQAPAFTPLGLVALVSALSAIAAVTIVRKRH